MLEILTSSSSIIVAIITGLFTYLYTRLDRKGKKFNISKEALQTFITVDSELKNSFFYSNFEENYFYAETGIKTTSKNITKFRDLYNKLELNWGVISRAQYHLDLDKEEISVNLKKNQIRLKNIVLIIALIFVLFGFGVFTFFTDSLLESKLKSIGFSFFVLISSLVFGYLLISMIDSINSAHIIQKRLKNISTISSKKEIVV